MHRKFVFRVSGRILPDLARFELVNLGSLLLNAILLPLFVEVGSVAVVPAQFLATAVTVFLSYFGHRFFSFRRPRSH
jgi:putative flippase GtrA